MTVRTAERDAPWKRLSSTLRCTARAANEPCALCHGALGPIDYRTRAEADREARARGEWWLIGQDRPLAFHADHIHASASGGPDVLDNLQPSHAICNVRASDKGRRRPATGQKPRVVTGLWVPHDGTGPALPGRAAPGTRTTTHTFTATPPRDPSPAPGLTTPGCWRSLHGLGNTKEQP